MPLERLLEDLSERTIATVGSIHDETRAQYASPVQRPGSFEQFSREIGNYLNHHHTRCISHGGRLSASEAESRAKEIVEQEYRRRGGDIVSAFREVQDGITGMRQILDIISEKIKAEAVDRYIRATFDRNASPCSYEEKLALMQQFMNRCGVFLPSSIQADDPARYSHAYKEIILGYFEALKKTAAVFRRL